MKLSKLFVVALMVGSLGVLGCGDDDGGTAGSGGNGTAGSGGNGTAGSGGNGTAGSGGSAGSGGTNGAVCPADADILCANCTGQQLNDCRADVFACNAFPLAACETCIEDSDPGCP